MAKKETGTQKKEKTATQRKPRTSTHAQSVKIEKVLVENFVSLQQVMTNLAVKFDNLSSQISKLLELFEISAKALAEKGALWEDKEDKRAAEKLDNLLEQSKIIARGVSLLHERNSPEPQYVPVQPMRPVQQMPQERLPYDFSKNPKIGK